MGVTWICRWQYFIESSVLSEFSKGVGIGCNVDLEIGNRWRRIWYDVEKNILRFREKQSRKGLWRWGCQERGHFKIKY